MADYVDHGGRSRGSVLYTDPEGPLPHAGYGPDPDRELDLPALFRFSLDEGRLDGKVQEVGLVAVGGAAEQVARESWAVSGPPAGDVTTAFQWRDVRPIPQDDDFFENVWREFREHGNID